MHACMNTHIHNPLCIFATSSQSTCYNPKENMISESKKNKVSIFYSSKSKPLPKLNIDVQCTFTRICVLTIVVFRVEVRYKQLARAACIPMENQSAVKPTELLHLACSQTFVEYYLHTHKNKVYVSMCVRLHSHSCCAYAHLYIWVCCFCVNTYTYGYIRAH